MKGLRSFTAKTAAAVLTVSMIFSGTAAAAPIDELNEIMGAQVTERESLLEETLDLSGFSEAKEENGVQVQADFGLSEETVTQLGLEELIPDGGRLSVNTQIDPNLKKWLFGLALGMSEDKNILDVTLYGDEEKLALSILQFFTGAVSLHAGNLREQYEKSAWTSMLGEMPEDIPEIEMDFYPEVSVSEEEVSSGEMEALLEQYGDNVKVEKTEDGETAVYKIICKSEYLIEIYREVLDQYIAALVESGLITAGDLNDAQADLEQMYDEMEDMLGEEFEVLVYVKDNLAEKMICELSIDTSDYVTEDGEEADTIMQADESFEGTVSYEIVFAEPEHALDGMDISMVVADAEGTEHAKMALQYRIETEGTTEKITAGVQMVDEGEVFYEGTPFEMSFDASTGDFDILIEMEDALRIMLDSTFTEIEKGKGFRWIMDELSFDDGAEEFAVRGEVTVSADPGEIQQPENERELFAMTQNDIMSFIMEIQTKAVVWSAQFTPEEETETAEG